MNAATGVRALDITENEHASALTAPNLAGVDVVIDFTAPEAAVENMRAVLSLGGRIVVGTTGWYAHLDEMKALAEKRGGALLYGTNFSIGVQKLFRLTAELAQLEGYKFSIAETHHVSKLDAPSGTAITLKQIIRSCPARRSGRDHLSPHRRRQGRAHRHRHRPRRHAGIQPRRPQPPRFRTGRRPRRRVAARQIGRMGLPRNLRPVIVACFASETVTTLGVVVELHQSVPIVDVDSQQIQRSCAKQSRDLQIDAL